MSGARPVLGVVACRRAIGEETFHATADRYVAAAAAYADAAALLIPASPGLVKAREVAPRLDGLLLTGSPSNLEPARYGEADAADAPGPFDPHRDAMTADLIGAMLDLGRPVFGICRGLQELNVAFGGALRRDVGPAGPGGPGHHAPDGADLDALFAHEHEVELAPGGWLRAAFGQPRLRVNSVHYQAVGRLGDGLKVEASAPDGLVEAFSAEVNGAPVLAVQWHPEWRTAETPSSQAFFHMLGRALRGQALAEG